MDTENKNSEFSAFTELQWVRQGVLSRIVTAKVELEEAIDAENTSGDAIDSIERGWHEGYVKALEDIKGLLFW